MLGLHCIRCFSQKLGEEELLSQAETCLGFWADAMVLTPHQDSLHGFTRATDTSLSYHRCWKLRAHTCPHTSFPENHLNQQELLCWEMLGDYALTSRGAAAQSPWLRDTVIRAPSWPPSPQEDGNTGAIHTPDWWDQEKVRLQMTTHLYLAPSPTLACIPHSSSLGSSPPVNHMEPK